MRKLSLTSIAGAAALMANHASASVVLTEDAHPTQGLPGYVTLVLSYQSTSGEELAGVDLTFTPATSEQINQAHPIGMDTAFTDSDPVITLLGGSPDQDSHFLFAMTPA